MIYIELTGRLKYASHQDKRKYITSDETWAFTEQPKTDLSVNDKSRIPPHDLFNLFTADIIQANTVFIR
jgi:hypothetical protein